MTKKRNAAREAGTIVRYHAERYIKPQSVGEHSWQIGRLLLILWPDAPGYIFQYAILHDITEIETGDIPCPTKLGHPKMKALLSTIEDDIYDMLQKVCWLPTMPALTLNELAIFKIIEYIEMMEYANDEIALGNSFMEGRTKTVCWDQITQRLGHWDTTMDPAYNDIRDRITNYLHNFVCNTGETYGKQ